MNLEQAFIKQIQPYFQLDQLAGALVILAKIVAIVLVAFILIKLIDRIIARSMLFKDGSQENFNPRLVTMAKLLQSITMYFIYFLAGLMILQEVGVKTTSILASAGIVGLMAGLGAQSLIKDVISGFFIITENQYAVGDYVQIGQLSGFVKEVGLRATRLADSGGEIHNIPNGQILVVTNLSRANRRATVDIKLPYSEAADRAIEVLKDIAEQAAKEMDYIKEGPTVLGITDFGDNSLVIRVTAMTEPLRQGDAERQLRSMIKKRFDEEIILLSLNAGKPSQRSDQPGSEKV